MADVTNSLFTEKFTVSTGDTVTLMQVPTKIISVARGGSSVIDYTVNADEITFGRAFGRYITNERISILYAV